MKAGIELMNIYCGSAALDVSELAVHRKLNTQRFENLMMKEKSVPMPFEDPISNAVNAAKPILDSLSEEEKNSIGMIITCTESGVDFGKSMSTYIHHYLGLKNNCRLFEIKNACYSGTAGFQMAINSIFSETAPGQKVLVIATDIMRMHAVDGSPDLSFAEPSSGSGAVAMLISDKPAIFQVDKGANGCYGFEVFDTCRPVPDLEAGNPDLSLLSYLDCCENSFKEYQNKVEGADYASTFHYLVYHSPFAGMVKGAHRANMRKFKKTAPADIEVDFNKRVAPSLLYGQRVGNMLGASTYLALASAIDNGQFNTARRLGVFSYGSGCCSEFYSGIVTPESQARLRKFNLADHLNERWMMTVEEYESTFEANNEIRFGTRNYKIDPLQFPAAFRHVNGKKRLIFSEIREFHRKYEWV